MVDTYAAGVVQDIFRMKLHGMSQDAIAGKLNRDGILSPMEYKNSMGINFRTVFRAKAASGWSPVAVRRILENEVYIGNLVQGRQSTPNHKVKKSIRKDKGDWVRVEKNHEPVVSERDFAVVQKLLGMDTRRRRTGRACTCCQELPFAGTAGPHGAEGVFGEWEEVLLLYLFRA